MTTNIQIIITVSRSTRYSHNNIATLDSHITPYVHLPLIIIILDLELVQRSKGRQHRGGWAEVEVEGVFPEGGVRHRPAHLSLLSSLPSDRPRHHGPHTLPSLVLQVSTVLFLPAVLGWSAHILRVGFVSTNWSSDHYSGLCLWPGLKVLTVGNAINYICCHNFNLEIEHWINIRIRRWTLTVFCRLNNFLCFIRNISITPSLLAV